MPRFMFNRTDPICSRGVRNAFGVLVLFCAALNAGEGPPPVPQPGPEPGEGPPLPKTSKPEDMQGLIWNAEQVSLDQEKNALILSGSAVVFFKGVKLEADNIVYFRETMEVYAEGHARMRVGESELAAEAAYIDGRNFVGYMIDAVVRVSVSRDVTEKIKADKKSGKTPETEPIQPIMTPKEQQSSFLRTRDPYGSYIDPTYDPQARTNLMLRASKIIIHSDHHYTGENAVITNDDMAHPMYGVKTDSTDLYMKDIQDPMDPAKTQVVPGLLVAKGASIQIFGINGLPFPTVTYDLSQKNVFFQIHYGKSSRWGYFSLSRVGYGLGGPDTKLFDPQHVYFDVDSYSKRGSALGTVLDWETGDRPQAASNDKDEFDRGIGYFKGYALDEYATSETDDIIRARQDLERRIQPKIDGFPLRVYDANLLFMKRRILENAGPPSFDLETHRDELRGFVDLQQHQPLKRFAGIDNLQLDFKFERESDRDFMLEYFQNNYLRENQPEGLASVRKVGDNYSLELLYRGNTQNFDGAPARSPLDYGTFTSYEPALTYSLVTTPLEYGIFMDTEMQAARLRRDFEKDIYDQNSFEADRAYDTLDLSRPFKLGFVNVVPHIGGQQAFYDNTATNGTAAQGALTYGLDATSRFYGLFPDLENDALGLKGMRHVVEMSMSYSGISNTEHQATDLLDFDPVDDLMRQDKVTFAIDQTLQTKQTKPDGTVHSENFAGLSLAMDYYPNPLDQNRLLDGHALDLLHADAFLRVLDAVKLTSSVGKQMQTGKLEEATYGIEFDPHTRWKLLFEERFNFDQANRKIIGSDQFHVQVSYQLSDRWRLDVEQIREARKSLQQISGVQVQRIGLTRSYGPFEGTFKYSIDRNNNDHTVAVSIKPTAVYRSVVVPAHDLLVPPAELSGEGELPEERNYDPFDLLKQRNKSKKKNDLGPGKPTENAPPAPAPPNDQDLPMPATPPADKRAEALPSAEDAKSFADPRKIDSRKQPDPVDRDEWTVPSAEPASTR